ncbi:Epi1-like protease inhibitor [Phytophthora infestans T30-4]|uniref:Epi1-like protease inhibitor n=1 Tax=Phytophthora infestans (strain T30-4) TaxID=403677 RepID=D0NXJ8_PHYIT|nr:Epi1-like protease inhibitor [Phytophthora infestans T30-4]EEY67798.1 Epi1-like protease inhibitor [Phytophthora infestans T30-4]|eukprot:XP_002997960.1 Epi1-like protease inhibitor [Phytophthora infestans T30-4]
MKFPVLLTLLAAAIATVQAQSSRVINDPSTRELNELDCPQICLDYYTPVADEEGNFYSNECYMKRAKCEKNSARTNSSSINDEPPSSKKCPDSCPDIALPVCVSDGIKYSNPCELKIAACKHPERKIVEFSYSSTCSVSKVAPQGE